MALSPEYGWPEPDNSSLVKNGAQDIRALGDAIDTSLWNVGYGQAGKNKIINGDFTINQRSFTSVTSSQYGFDRWNYILGGGTTTYSAQTFTVGAAPVAGYEAKNFARLAATGQAGASDYVALQQRIENVRTFAGQTATVSFWAKASTGTPLLGITLEQNFGAGGSSTVTTSSATFAITTSWVRYSKTISVPSISGKTVGTSDFLSCLIFQSVGATIAAAGYPNTGIQNATIDYWGVQVEYGSKATPFQTASGGSPQAELAMCQRYYWRSTSSTLYAYLGNGQAQSTTATSIQVNNPVPLRVGALTVDWANIGITDAISIQSAVTSLTVSQVNTTSNAVTTDGSSGLTQYRPYFLSNQNNVAGYIGFGAELQEMKMDKVTFVTDANGVEHAIIDRGNNEFTSMTKVYYDQQQAEQSTPSVIDEAEAK